MKAFIAIIFFATLIGATLQADWTYDDESTWHGQCNTGRLQSPINIQTQAAIVDRHEAHIRGPLQFRGYSTVNVTAANNGHTLQWTTVKGSQRPTLSGGPLRSNYTFEQLHLHWLSEHAVDGVKYPLEIHLVHVKAGLTMDEATELDDGITVIGVLCQVLSGRFESEYSLQELMLSVPDMLNKDHLDTKAAVIDINRLMSPEPQSFYTYQGSLTTPGCEESVTWIVMDKPLIISDRHYKTLSKVNVGGIDNYRSLQATDRVVYRSVASCAALLLPGFLSILSGLLSCATISSIKKTLCYILNVKKNIFGVQKASKTCDLVKTKEIRGVQVVD